MLKSPLAWPGGKGRVADALLPQLESQNPYASTFIEPFAGGAAIAIQVAYKMPRIQRIVINDADPAVAAFWQCVVDQSLRKDLVSIIQNTNLTQSLINICKVNINSSSLMTRAYALFIRNRTSFSGNITGGTKSNIHSRFNIPDLVSRIEGVGKLLESKNTVVTSTDFEQVMAQFDTLDAISYLDPPYYEKGKLFYRNAFKHDDHVRLANTLQNVKGAWILSYDDHPEIRKLYSSWASVGGLELIYSTSKSLRPRANELVISKLPVQHQEQVNFRSNYGDAICMMAG
jgi:DNA adenine methylase